MDLCIPVNTPQNSKALVIGYIRSVYPITISYQSKAEFVKEIELILTDIDTVVFQHDTSYLTRNTSAKHVNLFIEKLIANQVAPVTVLFKYDMAIGDYTPIIHCSNGNMKLSHHKLHIYAPFVLTSVSENLYDCLASTIKAFISQYIKAVMFLWDTLKKPPRSLLPHHFTVESKYFVVLYPKQIDEELEVAWRQDIHRLLSLPMEQPLLRRGQALLPVPRLSHWLGPNQEVLVCPHTNLKPLSTRGRSYIVKGRYSYKHYLQDSVDDRNWGCAYRSLQTLISWFMWQGEVKPDKLPTLQDIQRALVRVGDKPKAFIGSRQWIGSMEVTFCLEDLYGLQCNLLPVSRGAEMSRIAAPRLAQHFASGGGPVMIGGGQLAHTIIGIHQPEETSASDHLVPASVRFLVLDPHYTGPFAALKTILDKGWCGWKDATFWKPEVHYNLCFPPLVSPGRV